MENNYSDTKKLVILNPHVDDFLFCPPQFWLLGRKPLKKYYGLFKEKKILIDIDYRASSFLTPRIYSALPLLLRKLITHIELWLFYRMNKNETFILVDENKFDDERMILLAFSYKSLNGNIDFKPSFYTKYTKLIFHLSHYHIDTAIKSKNAIVLNNIHPNLFFAGDVDITQNRVFKRFFNWYSRKFIIMSFFISDRFLVEHTKKTHLNKILAVGSFHRFHKESSIYRYYDFMDFTGVTYLHNLRCKYFGLHHPNLTNLISEYKDYDSSKILKYFNVSQKKYFSYNLKDEFLKHSYCIAGEEEIGFPSVVAIECLCCGLMVIGKSVVYSSYPDFIKDRIIDEDILDSEGIDVFLSNNHFVELSLRDLKRIQDYFSVKETKCRFNESLKDQDG